jgi:cytochrome c oxidase cbb3-type subunit 3
VTLSLAVAAGVLGLLACQKMQRRLHEAAPMAAIPADAAALPGTGAPGARRVNPYAGNSYAMSEGERLYDWYNCSGCHARGGGGIGPPLMDEAWIYGKDPASLYTSIVDGRPNGMPAWRGRIPDYQIWQLVSYVEALRADRGIAAPPGPREEHLQAGEGLVSR